MSYGADIGKCLFIYQSDASKVQNAVVELRKMYPTLDHLISQDEGGLEHIVADEQDKISDMLNSGKFDKDTINF